MTPPPDVPDERVRAERVQDERVRAERAQDERVRAERALCGLVNGLAQRIGDHLREHATGLGLTAAQAAALRELNGPLTMRELAGRMCCEPSNATFVVDRLERQGLVERRPHPTDRRARQLVLTPAGTGLRERLLALLAADSPLAGLGPEQRLALQELLEQALARP